MDKKKDELTKATGTALAVIDYKADAGLGMEEADKDSFAIPFLAVLQGLSPQIETVPGAKPGLIINTITNELMDGAEIIPVAFQRRYLRWTPRNAGGGFKGQLTVAEVEAMIASGAAKANGGKKGTSLCVQENGQPGDELKDTRIHFVLMRSPSTGFWQPAIFSLASTAIKRSKRLLTMLDGIKEIGPDNKPFTPPSFSRIVRVTTEKETNAEGTWYSPVFAIASKVEDADLYASAKKLHGQIVSGLVKAQPPVDADGGEDGDGQF